MPASDFLAALRTLHEGGVQFIVVGGLAAVLNGAPVSTFDLDIVHSRTPENVARLLGVIQGMDATYRMQPSRRLRPNASHLSSPGRHNLLTTCGPLDVLGTIGRGLGYEDLLPHSVERRKRPGRFASSASHPRVEETERWVTEEPRVHHNWQFDID